MSAERKRARVRTRGWVVLGIVVVLIAGGATAAALTLSGTSKPKAAAKPNCVSSGCALVSQSLKQMQPVGFYGASCTGNYGDWYLKVMQEGKSDQLRAAYYLKWTSDNGTSVHPSGSVIVRPATGAAHASHVTVTLDHGKMTLEGTEEPSKTHVMATGTLTVSVLPKKGFPTLQFAETGLTKAESALGLNSPFDYKGQPLDLLIRQVQLLVGC
jgi:hypothetical protein